MDKKLSRRAVLLRGLQMPLVGGALLGLAACDDDGLSGEAADALVCADPKAMTSAQESVRKTLRYVEVSPHAQNSCSGCEFFSAGATNCGTCGIFDGNAVNPNGHCDSWSAAS